MQCTRNRHAKYAYEFLQYTRNNEFNLHVINMQFTHKILAIHI